MQTPFQAAINQLCAEKNIPREVVIEAVESAIVLAYKKDFGNPRQKIRATIGDDIAQMRIFEEREVAERIEDHDLDISLKEAKIIRPDAEIGQVVYVPVQMHESFGRIAAQTAKQVISQKLQEAERHMLFEKFKDREGQLLTARVQKADPSAVLLEIEGVSTLLYPRAQIPGEKYFTGQRLRVLLEKVELTSKGPQMRITRTSTDFILALFEQEIPEMREGLVHVPKIVREPGIRCKVAVDSNEGGIDPVGAFVGQKGVRINAVMEEIGDERLDVLAYSEDQEKLLKAALAPARIIKVEFFKGDREEDRVRVFVREEDRAVTIGKKGQNIRLAGDLIDLPVDVVTYDGPIDEIEEEEKPTKKAEKREVGEHVKIDQLQGVPEEAIQTLSELGLTQIKQFEGLRTEDLQEIGLNEKDANKVIDAVKRYIGE